MWRLLTDALAVFRRNNEIRVVVVTGVGQRAFVSGADISEFGGMKDSEEALARYGQAAAQAYDSVHNFPKPTIAMISGYCIGGGMVLACCCDMRICTPRSKFGIPAAKLGVGYDTKNIKRLMDVVGASVAKEILFTARQFDAEEAHAMKFVNQVVPDDNIDGYVTEYGRRIADRSAFELAAAKIAIREFSGDEISTALSHRSRCGDSTFI